MCPGNTPHEAHDALAPHALIERLYQLDKAMPDVLREQFIAAGGAVVPELIGVVEAALAEEQGEEESLASLYAARLLGALGDERAIPVLMRCLPTSEEFDGLCYEAVKALVAIGPAAIDRCIEAYAATNDENVRDSVLDVLGKSPKPDERIYEVFLDTLERSPELGAIFLGKYGDPRALPALSKALDDVAIPDDDSLQTYFVLMELQCAIEDLGGQLTETQLAKVGGPDPPRLRIAPHVYQEAYSFELQPRTPSQPTPLVRPGVLTRSTRKMGRNERCWCGSGKKYKKCHLDLDR